jgi:leucyl/phenylalanyl-tRNA---protein transferase
VKTTSRFPDPEIAGEDGIVAVGGKLECEVLQDAYMHGIFPWPTEGYPMLWFSPDPRGVIDFSELKINQRLKQDFKRLEKKWRVTWDQDFASVLRECRKALRKGQTGTWINDEIESAYLKMHAQGFAHSLEVWEGSELVGGIYGVQSAKYFSGESMFFARSNASKFAFVELVKHLEGQGSSWMDIQMVSTVTQSLGGKLIPRAEFLKRIRD